MKSIIIKLSAIVFFVASIKPVLANDLFEWSIGVDQWSNDAPATFGVARDNLVTIDYQKETSFQLEAGLTHELPLIPNIRYATSGIEQSGRTNLDQTFVLGGQIYAVASELGSEQTSRAHDLLFHYELFDVGLVKMDLGLLTRYQSVELDITKLGDSQSSSVKANKFVPMIHVNLQSSIPLLGFFVFAEFNKGDENKLYQGGLGYRFDNNFIPDVDLKVGIRKEHMEFSSNDGVMFEQDTDVTFAGLRVRF